MWVTLLILAILEIKIKNLKKYLFKNNKPINANINNTFFNKT